ncbi:MAG: polysaccharide biosynthesis/export family protein [Bacteroidota bacterium]
MNVVSNLNLRVLAILSLVIGMTTSCVTNRQVTYLQDLPESEIPTEFYTPEEYLIQQGDNLFIRVTTPDPRFSEMFNTLPVTSATVSSTEQSVDLLAYPVQADGTVDIPYLGSVFVEGKTLTEAKDILQDALVDYITDASISVKLVNNYLSILGEVTNPGLYPIYKDHLNIFQALSMAGDVDVYGRRSSISLIRSSPTGSTIKEFDLRDRNIVDSEYYYVMPNDVIYVQPIKGRFWSFSTFPYAIILTTITTFILVLNYIQ